MIGREVGLVPHACGAWVVDGLRLDPYVEFLRRYAPGHRVAEVGCGPALLSCVAARLGAREVHALDPGPWAAEAERLVRENRLESVVEVIHAPASSVAPREVDLAFSAGFGGNLAGETWFAEMAAAADWLRPGGRLAPLRVGVWVALLGPTDHARRVRAVRERLRRVGAAFDLRVAAIDGVLGVAVERGWAAVEPVGSPVLAMEVPVGKSDVFLAADCALTVRAPGTVSGAIVHATATLDADLHDDPQSRSKALRSHWVCAWGRSYPLAAGQLFPVRLAWNGGRVNVEPA